MSRDEIVYRFAGIRPLPRHEDTAPGFVSRDYRIEVDLDGGVPVVSLVGGKWTTFRALGESLSDRVLELLERHRSVSTAGLAIGGGRGFPRTFRARQAWIRTNLAGAGDRADQLLTRYGTRAAEVWEFIEQGDDATLAGGALSTRELEWMVHNELVVRLADVILRRTSLAFTGDVDAAVLEEVATRLASPLEWSPEHRDAEVDATIALLNDAHGLSIPTSARR